jgi:poly-D-alanine transfer protein DltD
MNKLQQTVQIAAKRVIEEMQKETPKRFSIADKRPSNASGRQPSNSNRLSNKYYQNKATPSYA